MLTSRMIALEVMFQPEISAGSGIIIVVKVDRVFPLVGSMSISVALLVYKRELVVHCNALQVWNKKRDVHCRILLLWN